MRWTVERLRVTLVVLAIGLTALILAAFLYARWQVRHIARDLPAKLGIQIQQSTEGFTYSKTDQGRTIFTLHAAKALQYRKAGRALLHDVRIQVFNQKDGQVDTIAGNQFEYDPHTGIVRALDEARIDLHTPAPSGKSAPTGEQQDSTIHVVTHGLVFDQNTGMAATEGLIQFQLPQGSGQAVGAVFDSKQSKLLLKSNVEVHAETQHGPALLYASQALYDQHANQVQLQNARYSTAVQHASANVANIILRADSSVENIDAQHNVQYQSKTGESVTADSMIAALDEHNSPLAAHFSGNVHFQVQQPQQNSTGSAADAQLLFNSQGHLRQAIMAHAVHFQQRVETSTPPIARNLQADHLVMDFSSDRAGHAELQQAIATGSAVFHQNSIGEQLSQTKAPQDTTIRAQTLTAQFAPGNQLLHVDAKGNTQLRSVAANGDVDTSSGDTLQVQFLSSSPQPHVGNNLSTPDTSTIQTAIQQGHVVIQQIAAAKPAGPRKSGESRGAGTQISTATATKAEYQGATQILTLTGAPHFYTSDLDLTAQKLRVDRASGEVVAIGLVQTTIVGSGSAGILGAGQGTDGTGLPTHIIADRAGFDRDKQTAIFTGHARLWQGQSLIEAPVIEILQAQQSLQAYDAGKPGTVHCTFVALSHSTTATQGKDAPMPVYVTSTRLLYSDAEHKAHFSGNVEVATQASNLQAETADVYLQPSASGNPAIKNSSVDRKLPAQSSVERIVATGNVRLVQPGRLGTGAQIVYTASDGRFVLTGTDRVPPRVVDSQQGSVTGHALIFQSEQNAVQVQGGNSVTTTQTRVKK